MKKKIATFLSLLFLLSISSALAETIVLKSGKTIEGKILERTDKYIKVDIEGITLTYYLDDIISVDGIRVTPASTEKNNLSANSNKTEEAFNGKVGGINYHSTYSTGTNKAYALLLNGGMASLNSGDYNGAISQFSRAIELDPNDPDAYIDRGLAYERNGNYDKAIADYNKVLEITPEDNEAYTNRGLAYYRKANYDQAIADHDKSIKINPNNPSAYANRGLAYQAKGNLDQAIADYNKAIEIDPGWVTAYNNLAVTYYSKQEYIKAWDYVHKIEGLGQKVNPNFLADLKRASGRDK